MTTEQIQAGSRPQILFVDDEQRVLNSMRIMFRRQFDLFLASHGAEALEIVKNENIDVIVADHRMPKMTGVEVLSRVRTMSPRTVRILLTGYADLDAVEGSINDGEVFRFLTKPCPPNELRETVALAARLSREAPAPTDADASDAASEALGGREVLDILEHLESEDSAASSFEAVTLQPVLRPAATATPEAAAAEPTQPPTSAAFDPDETDVVVEAPRAQAVAEQLPAQPPPPRPRQARGLGVIVFSRDDGVVDAVQRAVRGLLPVHRAANIVQVVETLTEHQPGVLVTDISADKDTIQAMTAQLKEHLPELVTICVSEHRDVMDMVWLINHGQIFRFLRKPLSTGRCAISLQAALKHHRMLLQNPELVKRHEVQEADAGIVDGVMSRLKAVRRLWASP